jgi:hypothetical protein
MSPNDLGELGGLAGDYGFPIVVDLMDYWSLSTSGGKKGLF